MKLFLLFTEFLLEKLNENFCFPYAVLLSILASTVFLISNIKHLMDHYCGNLSPNNAERQQVLTKVLASMLWQAAIYDGGSKFAYVCHDSGRSKFHSSLLYRNDGITEKIQFTRCSTLKATENSVQEFLPQFQSVMGKGCILFLYSLILSRGKLFQFSLS